MSTDAIDFAILTALSVERDAVLKRVRNARRIAEPEDPFVYYEGEMEIAGSAETYKVVVTSFLEAGNVEAAAETTALLNRWHPRFVLMVGIAGGFTEKGVARGDVVVANFIHYYEHGKVKAAGEERRPQQFRPDRLLWAKAKNYEAADWKGEIGASLPAGFESYVPRAHFGPLACGEKVVASLPMIAELLGECPPLLGVAMEAAGVAKAVENAGLTFLEIRGVSDAADLSKDDAWHSYAANAAAAFMAGLLRAHPVRAIGELATREKAGASTERALCILRAQSLRVIDAREILDALPSDFGSRDVETVGLEFTDLMTGDRRLSDPEAAARRTADPEGPLVQALSRRDEREFAFHGLVHIPLAALAGFIVSDRLKVRLFDFHPTPGSESWSWPELGESYPAIQIAGVPSARVAGVGDVIVRMSVSYPAGVDASRVAAPGALLELDLQVPGPERGIVRSEAQVRAYGFGFRKVLDAVAGHVPGCRHVHLFYAGPVSLAFHLGQQISENIHPPVVVWNYRREEGYAWGIDLRAACREEACLLKTAATP